MAYQRPIATAEQHVDAAYATERAAADCLASGGFTASKLFDPNFNPKLHARANAVMRHLRTSHDLTYVDRKPIRQISDTSPEPWEPSYCEHDPGMQAEIFVHFVSKPNTVFVFRDRTEQFSWLWSMAWPDGRCTIREAAGCTGAYGNTHFLTRLRGQYLLAWELCSECSLHLEDIAVSGEILAEADARVAFDATGQAAVDKYRRIRAEQEGK